MLVEYLPVTAQFDGKILGNKAQALDEILDDSGVLALRVGHAVPEPVVQARALSIVLPVSGGILTFDDLVVEALDPGYALYSRDRQSTTTTTLTVTGSSRYGAIAPGWKGLFCDDGFAWGYAYNYLDRGAAVSRAESECRSGGLRDCEWIVVFTHCGSLAYGESSSGCGLRGGSGATRSAAEQDALSICRESYSDCEIAVGDDPGAGAPPPGEARSGRGTSDSPFGASNPEARPEAVPTK